MSPVAASEAQSFRLQQMPTQHCSGAVPNRHQPQATPLVINPFMSWIHSTNSTAFVLQASFLYRKSEPGSEQLICTADTMEE